MQKVQAADNEILVSQYLANKDSQYLTVYIPKTEVEYNKLDGIEVYIKGIKADVNRNIVDERASYFGLEIKLQNCAWPSLDELPANSNYFGYKTDDIDLVLKYTDGYANLSKFKLAEHYFDQSFAISKDLESWCTTNYSLKEPLFDIVGHPFESYIRSLFEDGVVAGYSDKTFRPDYPVTRGAMAKFVVNGTGLSIDTSCEKFPDVGTDHPFFDFVTTLKCRGIIAGYTDGTFRPGELVTRGQAAKFVINAAREKKRDPGFLPVLQNDKFSDVQRDNPFYEHIMAAYSYFIVSGFSDGTFRPNLWVTRGAMSKMVENTRLKLKGLALTPPSEPVIEPVKSLDLFADADVKLLIDDDAILGNKDSAEVIVVEWSDYQCPFCRKFWDETSPALFVDYVDTGKVVWVFRDLPLSFHTYAYERALAAECAGEVGGDINYFEYHDWLFENQSTLITSDLYDYAENIGISRTEFASCFDNEELNFEIDNDLAQAAEFEINGTPTFVIVSYNSDGELVVDALAGAYPYSSFQEIIEKQLND